MELSRNWFNFKKKHNGVLIETVHMHADMLALYLLGAAMIQYKDY